MRMKRLISETIIPPDLYVERGADRQLAQIVDGMGRPGYVLVSRQMGKTNLLLNMKRKLENGPDVVLYLDLSTRSDTLKGWFRRVIDTACEVRPDLFSQTAIEIASARNDLDLEANTEFDRHLRAMLRVVPARMIIVLDEIDALVSSTYSDKIFSQIRSMYFARVTFPEYKKLTYVLSGVAEPTDLIKDKALSPFNIGEKIYLDDFTEEEFRAFLGRAELQFDENIVKAIHGWTGGNPRMTWDLCSELEDRLIQNEHIDMIAVDDAVQKLYLTDFDRSPIDHIRALVENDPQVRDAIVSIKYGKGDTLDDKVKGRLYLAGVTSSKITTKTISLKNKIIDAALSENWIEGLSRAKKGLLTLAEENYSAKRYELAIRQYQEFLDDPRNEGKLPFLNRFQLAMCRYQTRDYDNAVTDLNACLVEQHDPALDSSIHYYIGMTRISSGKYAECIEHFKIASVDSDRPYYLSAQLNLGTAYLHVKVPQAGQEVVRINNFVLEEIQRRDPEHKLKDNDELIWTARYNLARIYQGAGKLENALIELKSAEPFLSPAVVPAFNLFFYELDRDQTEREARMRSTVNLILEKRLLPSSGLPAATLDFTDLIFSRILVALWRLNLKEEIDRLINFISKTAHDGRKTPFSILMDMWDASPASQPGDFIGILYCAVERYISGAEVGALIRAYRSLAYYTRGDDRERYRGAYLDHFEAHATSEYLTQDDFVVLWNIAQSALQQKAYPVTRRAVNVMRKHAIFAAEKFGALYALLLSFGMAVYERAKEGDRTKEAAKQILALTDDDALKNQEQILDGTVIQQLRETAQRALLAASEYPFRNLGRNTRVFVRYGDGPAVEKKFKIVRDDLIFGRCVLVSVASSNSDSL